MPPVRWPPLPPDTPPVQLPGPPSALTTCVPPTALPGALSLAQLCRPALLLPVPSFRPLQASRDPRWPAHPQAALKHLPSQWGEQKCAQARSTNFLFLGLDLGSGFLILSVLSRPVSTVEWQDVGGGGEQTGDTRKDLSQ